MIQEELGKGELAPLCPYFEAWQPAISDQLPFLFIQLPEHQGMSVFNDDIFREAMLWMSR